MSKLTKILNDNKKFTLANCTYLACSFVDFASTAFGIETEQIREINPIIQDYISEFGTYGILIPKAIFAYGSLLLLNIVDDKPLLRNKIKFKSKPVIYVSSAITATIGLSWLLSKYFLS